MDTSVLSPRLELQRLAHRLLALREEMPDRERRLLVEESIPGILRMIERVQNDEKGPLLTALDADLQGV